MYPQFLFSAKIRKYHFFHLQIIHSTAFGKSLHIAWTCVCVMASIVLLNCDPREDFSIRTVRSILCDSCGLQILQIKIICIEFYHFEI